MYTAIIFTGAMAGIDFFSGSDETISPQHLSPPPLQLPGTFFGVRRAIDVSDC